MMTNTKENVTSDFDNRTLVEFPKFGVSGYKNAIEMYLQDRLGFRDMFVTEYQVLNDKIAHELTHPIYTYGQDDYIFFKMHDNIEFSDYHQTFAEAVVKMKNYCESRGVPFYFMFDPEKISVYRRYLPEGVFYNDEWVDVLIKYLEENGVNVINNRDLLLEKSYEEQVFNKQYDAGHWNDLGMYYGTNNLWKKVSEDFPEVTEYSFSDFFVKTQVGEYLAASKFVVNEEIPEFEPKYSWDNISDDYDGIKQDSRYPFFSYYVNQEKTACNYPKMLVFHGSYYNRGPEFLIGRASEYIGVHNYQNVLNLPYYFNLFQPEMVVFEVAEYTLEDSYFDLEIMDGLEFNPMNNCLKKELASIEKDIISTNREQVELIAGNKYDRICISDVVKNARYVYISSGGTVFDLIKEDDSDYYADIPHGIINGTAIIYILDSDGNQYLNHVEVSDTNSISLNDTQQDYN